MIVKGLRFHAAEGGCATRSMATLKLLLAAAAWGVLLLNCALPGGSTIIHGGSNCAHHLSRFKLLRPAPQSAGVSQRETRLRLGTPSFFRIR